MGLINVREAAQLLGVPISQVYTLVSAKEIPYIRYNKTRNGKILFDEKKLAEWAESRAFEPVAS